jgi:hypothetical protein
MQVEEFHFNHDTGSATSDALTIRKGPGATPSRPPSGGAVSRRVCCLRRSTTWAKSRHASQPLATQNEHALIGSPERSAVQALRLHGSAIAARR